jgi:hypothetical protein
MLTLDSEISTIGGWNTVYATKGDPSSSPRFWLSITDTRDSFQTLPRTRRVPQIPHRANQT